MPDLDLDDATHRARFDRLMANHPGGSELDPDKFYAAQVVWDETMAQNAAGWVAAHAPQRQLVVLAGSAHCRREAIPARVERRVTTRVANVRLSASSPEDSDGFNYTLLSLPITEARDEVRLINTGPSLMAALLRLDWTPDKVRTINLAFAKVSGRTSEGSNEALAGPSKAAPRPSATTSA